MAGCGKLLKPEEQRLEGDSLRCGVNLYWKVPGGTSRERKKQTLLCRDCKGENNEKTK
jgi:hypothetical protein